MRAALSLLITGDEEGPSVNGTRKRVLEWMAAHGHIPDMCAGRRADLESSSLGDTIKIGRRGSMNAWVTVQGRQGHSAYPQKADNPVHRLVAALAELTAKPLDARAASGSRPARCRSPASRSIMTATNVIPGAGAGLSQYPIQRPPPLFGRADRNASASRFSAATPPQHELRIVGQWRKLPHASPAPSWTGCCAPRSAATGITPRPDTGGGTSDARFITRLLPGGRAGRHWQYACIRWDECVPVAELQAL